MEFIKPFSKYLDHTLLSASATDSDIDRICEEAKKYDCYSVCVNTCQVARCSDNLKNTDIKIAAVVGFPLGQMTSDSKAFEANEAFKYGASEVDMVINVGKLKSKDYAYVTEDIKKVVEVAKEYNGVVKVIIETCLLTKDEIVKACELSMKANANFVKTSTGFSTGGATLEDVKLMKDTVGDKYEVKASGGIRDYETAKIMIEAGATRIGTSNGKKLVEEYLKTK